MHFGVVATIRDHGTNRSEALAGLPSSPAIDKGIVENPSQVRQVVLRCTCHAVVGVTRVGDI